MLDFLCFYAFMLLFAFCIVGLSLPITLHLANKRFKKNIESLSSESILKALDYNKSQSPNAADTSQNTEWE